MFYLIYLNVVCLLAANDTKFADDGTLWHTGKDVAVQNKKVSEDTEKILIWCKKWRMKLSLGKTEVTLFHTKGTCERAEKECVCKEDGKELMHNPYPKKLGITLDKQLNFQEHVNKTEKKASIALRILREVKGSQKSHQRN